MTDAQENHSYFAPLRPIQPAMRAWAESLDWVEKVMRADIKQYNLPLDCDARTFHSLSATTRTQIVTLLTTILDLMKNADNTAEKNMRKAGNASSPTVDDFKHNAFQTHMLEALIEDVTDAKEAALYNPLHVVLGVLRQMKTHLMYYAEALSHDEATLGIPEIEQALATCIDARQGTFGNVALVREGLRFPETRIPATVASYIPAEKNGLTVRWSLAEIIEMLYFFIGNATRALTDASMNQGTGGYAAETKDLALDIALDTVTVEQRTFLAIEIYNAGTGTIDLEKIRNALTQINPEVIAEYASLHHDDRLLTAARAARRGAKQLSEFGATDVLLLRSGKKYFKAQKSSGGIGLAVADRMIVDRGGTVMLNNYAQGVCVTVLLPTDADLEEREELLKIAHTLKKALAQGAMMLQRYEKTAPSTSSPLPPISAS